MDIPYAYSDLVFTNNMNGVQVAEVMTATVSYENFNETHIAAQTFNNKRDAIGSKWRATTTGTGSTSHWRSERSLSMLSKMLPAMYTSSGGTVSTLPVQMAASAAIPNWNSNSSKKPDPNNINHEEAIHCTVAINLTYLHCFQCTAAHCIAQRSDQ